MRHIAASKSLALVIGAFVQQVRVKPDDRTRWNFDGNPILIASIAGQFEFILLRSLDVVVFRRGSCGRHSLG